MDTVTIIINNDTGDAHFPRFNLVIGVTGLLQLPVILLVLVLMIFVYKTYRTTFQRLILYYVVLGLWYEFSCALRIALVYVDERWVCIVEQFLNFSSLVAYYAYIAAITNLLLLLVPCLMKGRPLSKRSSKLAECACVALTIIVALTAASIVQTEDSDEGAGLIHCKNHRPSNQGTINISSMIAISVFFAVDLEVVSASLFLCFIFCFIRWRKGITSMSILLRNSVCHVGINAIVMGLDALGTGGDFYRLSSTYHHKLDADSESRGYLEMTGVLVWNVFFTLAVGISVVVQAILCMRTSTERLNTCCKRCCGCHVPSRDSHSAYVAIDGKDTCAATNPASSRVSQPSYTYFTVPYTGEFPSTESHGKNEQRPLSGCFH